MEGKHMMSKKEMTLKRMGHEMKENPPAVLAQTRKKKGAAAAERQRRAILLSKARRAGAHIPKPHEEEMEAVHKATA